jgi:hypothetical protein
MNNKKLIIIAFATIFSVVCVLAIPLVFIVNKYIPKPGLVPEKLDAADTVVLNEDFVLTGELDTSGYTSRIETVLNGIKHQGRCAVQSREVEDFGRSSLWVIRFVWKKKQKFPVYLISGTEKIEKVISFKEIVALGRNDFQYEILTTEDQKTWTCWFLESRYYLDLFGEDFGLSNLHSNFEPQYVEGDNLEDGLPVTYP